MQPQHPDILRDWDFILAQLPSHWRQIAQELGLWPAAWPAHMGTKVTDLAQILRLVFYHVATNSSLLVTTAAFAACGELTLSPVALHKWMRKLGPLIAALLSIITGANEAFAKERWAGYSIVTTDATSVSRPGAKGTTARIHYVLGLPGLSLNELEVTDEREGETFRRFKAHPGELWVADRAYANPPGIAHLHQQGAEVLVRYNRGSLPLYDIHGKPLDVLSKLERLSKPGRIGQWYAQVHPESGEPIRGHLYAVRLPKDKAEQAERRIRQEQGDKVTPQTLQMAKYVVVFTTVAPERLSAERVLELYRLRWQVELHIKRDKSIGDLDRLPNFRPDTIHTWLCTKLLLLEIARKLWTPQVSFPPGAWEPGGSGTGAEEGAEAMLPGGGQGAMAGVDLGLAAATRGVAAPATVGAAAGHRAVLGSSGQVSNRST